MKKIPKSLQEKLENRQDSGAFRTLKKKSHLIDFSSNDYLGLARLDAVSDRAAQILNDSDHRLNGATGSRLLTGHYLLFERAESEIATFHEVETSLIFNSGYDANLGLFSSLPQRNDVIFYDEFAHASIRDGIRLSLARSYGFRHNDFEDLKKKIRKANSSSVVWVVTEAVFSMDGDSPDWENLSEVCQNFSIGLIVDEAHATGVLNELPEIYRKTGLENSLIARVVTFGKAMGCHGAAVLGDGALKEYLINFARSLIYTTALPPVSVATILAAYESLGTQSYIRKLRQNIAFFNQKVCEFGLEQDFIFGSSAIHCCIIPGNESVRNCSRILQQGGFDVRPILSPTVPEGKERLRFCLHAFNEFEEIEKALEMIRDFLDKA